MTEQPTERVDDDTVHLDEMVCFHLHAATRAMNAVYRPLLEPLDLTYPQYLVLVALWENGDLSVGELSQRLQLDYGTMTPLLKRMERRGLVHRVRSARDERTVIVALAPDGEGLREHAPRIYDEICRIFSLTPDRAKQVLGVLQSIVEKANTATEAPSV